MKNLILLLLICSCASRPDYEELYYDCALEKSARDLRESTKAMAITIEELEAAICRDYPHDEKIQEELCQ